MVQLSAADQGTSEIIDVLYDADYVFLDVSVGFGIYLPLRYLSLRAAGFTSCGGCDDQELLGAT